MNGIVETTIGSGTVLGNDIVNLIYHAGIAAKIVLFILVVFSLISWGIMLDKWLMFRRNAAGAERFLGIFKKASNLDDVVQAIKSLKPDPLSRIFIAGFKVLRKKGGGPAVDQNSSAYHLMEMAIDDAIGIEIQRLEQRLPFLGTCGSVTPFIGLFGTVWGIMDAFRSIGAAGSASIAAVAPGIAEALIATAVGLLAAIPAVIGYNVFLSKIRISISVFERFRTTFLASID